MFFFKKGPEYIFLLYVLHKISGDAKQIFTCPAIFTCPEWLHIYLSSADGISILNGLIFTHLWWSLNL